MKNTSESEIIKNIEKYIDQTLLKPDTSDEILKDFINKSKNYDFFAICLNPVHTAEAKRILQSTDIKVVTVVGFPLGANKTEIKIKEAESVLKDGADEIDMVMNIGKLKSTDYGYVENEIRNVKNICGEKILKVIIETSLLSLDEIKTACEIIASAGADFVKTSTGFLGEGAKLEYIKLIKDILKPPVKIKASGGIRSLKDAVNMIKAGADRIGTSSGFAIADEAKKL